MFWFLLYYVVGWALGLNFLGAMRAEELKEEEECKKLGKHCEPLGLEFYVIILTSCLVGFGWIWTILHFVCWCIDKGFFKRVGQLFSNTTFAFLDFLASFHTKKRVDNLTVEELEALLKQKKGE